MNKIRMFNVVLFCLLNFKMAFASGLYQFIPQNNGQPDVSVSFINEQGKTIGRCNHINEGPCILNVFIGSEVTVQLTNQSSASVTLNNIVYDATFTTPVSSTCTIGRSLAVGASCNAIYKGVVPGQESITFKFLLAGLTYDFKVYINVTLAPPGIK